MTETQCTQFMHDKAGVAGPKQLLLRTCLSGSALDWDHNKPQLTERLGVWRDSDRCVHDVQE